jgi:phosphohistidine phosphatase
VILNRTLVLLRHAKSDWPEGVPDVERPLADRGVREAPIAGRWLRDNVPRIDLVVHSPAKRAADTWALVAAELGYSPEVRVDVRLYSEPVDTLLQVVTTLPADAHTVLFVGHNPELSALAATLSGSDVELKTAGIAVLSTDGDWKAFTPGSAELRQVVTPR